MFEAEDTAKTIIFLLEDDESWLSSIRLELQQRYAANYQIVCERSEAEALARLAELQKAGKEVAIVLADCTLPGTSGPDFLAQAHKLCPQAKRGLLVGWEQPSCSDDLIVDAMSLNKIDAFTAKPGVGPAANPNEEFHHFISEFLTEWAREHRPQFEMFRIVGEQWARRSYELRDLLTRNSVPFGFFDVASEAGRALLEQAGAAGAALPVVVCFDGTVLADPSNTELAQFVGARTEYRPDAAQGGSVVDVVIAGAGPAGLSAAVNSGSEGLRTVMIEREALGGQAGMSSRIRNYLGFPTGISGDDLAERAYQQSKLFGVNIIFTQAVTGLKARGDERVVVLSDGSEITARTVILAMGVTYRRLEIPRLESLMGSGVFYGAVGAEAMALRGKEVFIVGGANSAGQAAVHLSKYASRVTMVVRASSLSLSMSEYLIQEIRARENIRVLLNCEVIDGGGEYHLEHLVIRHRDSGKSETLPAAALFVMIGSLPHTDWLPPQVLRDAPGFILTGENLLRSGALPEQWPLERRPFALESSLPGVFAVGDVRHRSVKRVASAVGEGSMCVQYLHQYLMESQKERAR